MKRKRNNKSTFFWVGGLVVLAIVLLGWNSFKGLFVNTSTATTREVATSCTTDMATEFHIHPTLQIIANGIPQTIPANIGISLSCMHPIHTHDNAGTIHVESPEKRDFTLDDFFFIWGPTFSRDQILDYKADATHEIVMTVDGQPSQEYEKLVLKDKQKIVIEYKTK